MSESSLASKLPDGLQSSPPKARELTIIFPAEHVVLIAINREKVMNCLNIDTMHDLADVWKWYDAEPSL
jgi:enoyl-CoA hydratase/carnithine racemase